MLLGIALIMGCDEGNIVQQNEGHQVGRQPRVLFLCLRHSLQRLQGLPPKLGKSLVQKDIVDLGSHNRRNGNRAIGSRDTKRLFSDDLKGLCCQADGRPEIKGFLNQLFLLDCDIWALGPQHGELVCPPQQLLRRAEQRLAHLSQPRPQIILVARLRRFQIDQRIRLYPSSLRLAVLDPSPLQLVAWLRDESADPQPNTFPVPFRQCNELDFGACPLADIRPSSGAVFPAACPFVTFDLAWFEEPNFSNLPPSAGKTVDL